MQLTLVCSLPCGIATQYSLPLFPLHCRFPCFCTTAVPPSPSPHLPPPHHGHHSRRTHSLSHPCLPLRATRARTHFPHAALSVSQLHTTPPQLEEVAKVKSVVEKAVDKIRDKKKGKAPFPVSSALLLVHCTSVYEVHVAIATDC